MKKTMGPRLASRFMNTGSPNSKLWAKLLVFFFFLVQIFFFLLLGARSTWGGPPFVPIFLVKILKRGGSNSFFFSWASVFLD